MVHSQIFLWLYLPSVTNRGCHRSWMAVVEISRLTLFKTGSIHTHFIQVGRNQICNKINLWFIICSVAFLWPYFSLTSTLRRNAPHSGEWQHKIKSYSNTTEVHRAALKCEGLLLHSGACLTWTIYLSCGRVTAPIPSPAAETTHSAFGRHRHTAYFSLRGAASWLLTCRLTWVASTNSNTILLGLLIGQQE